MLSITTFEKFAGVASSAALLDFLALNFLGVMGVLLIICGRVYRRGRYKKTREGGMPSAPGAYRARSKKTGAVVYHGETVNLRARDQQHARKKSRHKRANYYTEYKVADKRSTSNTRRKHEKTKIRQHKPKFNRNSGGGGRKANGGSGRKRRRGGK